jgi:acylphosphatase
MTRTLLVRIRGQVQGVGYRAWTDDKARALGLSGWVRNRRDGSVEALFSGESAKVDEMVGYCRQGPMAARVEAVDAVAAAAPTQPGFRMLPTA